AVVPGGAGRLLRGHPGLLAAPQARAHAGRDAAGGPVHPADRGRGGRGGGAAVVLAAGLLHVPVPPPGDAQALHRAARAGGQRSGTGGRARLRRRRPVAAAVAGRVRGLPGGAGAGAVHQQRGQRGAVLAAAGAVAAVPATAVLDQPRLVPGQARQDARRPDGVRRDRPRQPGHGRHVRDGAARGHLTMPQSWGRYPSVQHEALVGVRDRAAPLPAFAGSALPYGNGRSYGDSCLNPGGALLLARGLDRYIALDAERGVLQCEAGVSLEEIQRLVVPRGWCLPVMPGTLQVTVGGAIANDVHGKNHARMGSFGDHVLELELLRSDGSRRTCGPGADPDWFRATVGGLGLTG